MHVLTEAEAVLYVAPPKGRGLEHRRAPAHVSDVVEGVISKSHRPKWSAFDVQIQPDGGDDVDAWVRQERIDHGLERPGAQEHVIGIEKSEDRAGRLGE